MKCRPFWTLNYGHVLNIVWNSLTRLIYNSEKLFRDLWQNQICICAYFQEILISSFSANFGTFKFRIFLLLRTKVMMCISAGNVWGILDLNQINLCIYAYPVIHYASSNEWAWCMLLCSIFRSFLSLLVCPLGYKGFNCSKTCRFPTFGKRCQNICNCHHTVCDFRYGCEKSSGKYINYTY